MKLTLQIQLLPDKQQAHQLKSTMERFNQACSWLAQQAFERKTANKITLQQSFYYELRQQFGLSAQMASICIRHVGGTYSRDKSILPVFRPNAAMPYDSRILSFKGVDRVSILTLEGRLIIPFVMGRYTNTETEKVRQKQNKVRRSLGRKAGKAKRKGSRPKNIKRKLKALSGKERRFKANENHRISKQIVEKATDTNRGIGLEDLTGIREGTRFRKTQRDKMSKWSFAELRGFIEYKAKLTGIPVIPINPRNTSRTCPKCGHIDKGNRLTRGLFLCCSCGHFDHADIVGATNIATAAKVAWREVAEQRLKEAA